MLTYVDFNVQPFDENSPLRFRVTRTEAGRIIQELSDALYPKGVMEVSREPLVFSTNPEEIYKRLVDAQAMHIKDLEKVAFPELKPLNYFGGDISLAGLPVRR